MLLIGGNGVSLIAHVHLGGWLIWALTRRMGERACCGCSVGHLGGNVSRVLVIVPAVSGCECLHGFAYSGHVCCGLGDGGVTETCFGICVHGSSSAFRVT